MTDPKRSNSPTSGFGQAMGLSIEMVTTTAVGTGLGWLVDRGLHTKWVFLLIGALLGGAGGITRVYRSWTKK
ncbi:MAG: AtpZ/AtpI family protein [Actinomycetota bacterium]|nr:AtpZ/AtpI family protein [Actinomycetota bacterium]